KGHRRPSAKIRPAWCSSSRQATRPLRWRPQASLVRKANRVIGSSGVLRVSMDGARMDAANAAWCADAPLYQQSTHGSRTTMCANVEALGRPDGWAGVEPGHGFHTRRTILAGEEPERLFNGCSSKAD